MYHGIISINGYVEKVERVCAPATRWAAHEGLLGSCRRKQNTYMYRGTTNRNSKIHVCRSTQKQEAEGSSSEVVIEGLNQSFLTLSQSGVCCMLPANICSLFVLIPRLHAMPGELWLLCVGLRGRVMDSQPASQVSRCRSMGRLFLLLEVLQLLSSAESSSTSPPPPRRRVIGRHVPREHVPAKEAGVEVLQKRLADYRKRMAGPGASSGRRQEVTRRKKKEASKLLRAVPPSFNGTNSTRRRAVGRRHQEGALPNPVLNTTGSAASKRIEPQLTPINVSRAQADMAMRRLELGLARLLRNVDESGNAPRHRAGLLYLQLGPWPDYIAAIIMSAAANPNVFFYFVGPSLPRRLVATCRAQTASGRADGCGLPPNCGWLPLNEAALAGRIELHLGLELNSVPIATEVSTQRKLCDLKPMWPALFPELSLRHTWIGYVTPTAGLTPTQPRRCCYLPLTPSLCTTLADRVPIPPVAGRLRHLARRHLERSGALARRRGAACARNLLPAPARKWQLHACALRA